MDMRHHYTLTKPYYYYFFHFTSNFKLHRRTMPLPLAYARLGLVLPGVDAPSRSRRHTRYYGIGLRV